MINKNNIQKALTAKIGANLSACRKRSGWTQGELAEKIGVDTETISRFERGATMPSLVTLQMLAVTLDTTMADFISESSPMPNDLTRTVCSWLSGLQPADRELVMDMIQRWCSRLRQDK
jgi:transcriptional regulator with XRE-family HTH domain